MLALERDPLRAATFFHNFMDKIKQDPEGYRRVLQLLRQWKSDESAGWALRIATACSGSECPGLALAEVSAAVSELGVGSEFALPIRHMPGPYF